MREGTRETIARVAARLFAERGFAGVSVRALATEAGVDPALVIRHFGSKEALFLETAVVEGSFTEVLDGPVAGLGRRLAAYVVRDADERMRGTYAALVWASSSPDVRRRVAEVSRQELLLPLAARLSGDDVELRARLVTAQLDGLMRAMWIAADPTLLGSPDEVVEVYGDAMQRLLTPRSPARPRAAARSA